ncbi:hypothetical protein OEZ86_012911 [Tetradesmus obliquus]|nr:hypothetical protein OEZ86_012911 [Tetradesmus obliquus]
MSQLLPAVALAANLEPYKKLLGVLVRKDCISLAVSNAYLNLAEPLGGLMLREGRLSARSLQRMLADQQLAGFIVGCEVDDVPEQQPPQEQQVTASQKQAVQQVQGVLEQLSPGLQGGWYGAWSAAAGGGLAYVQQGEQQQQQGLGSLRAAAGVTGAATQVAGSSSSSSSSQGALRCSLGQQFLQDYLDSLGALNTFG